jgi:hypothetical protein
MGRIQHAGWLVAVPPLAMGLDLLGRIDSDGLTGSFTRQFVKTRFEFWSGDVNADFRPAVALNLTLFVAAGVAFVWALVSVRARILVIVVAAAQAVVALTGVVWDFLDRRSPPEFVLHTIPVMWGRWTSFLYLGCALVALLLASTASGGARSSAPTAF